MLAVPFQGYAAAAMAFCAPATAPAQLMAGTAHDHSHHHEQASAQDAEHHHAALTGNDGSDHHAAQSAQDDSAGAFHKCGNCAACHFLGMTPTLGMSVLHGLQQAELAEPFRAMATVSPRVPHKPPRA